MEKLYIRVLRLAWIGVGLSMAALLWLVLNVVVGSYPLLLVINGFCLVGLLVLTYQNFRQAKRIKK